MKDATEVVRHKLADEYETEVSVYGRAVSCDGSWQRRGYSSINGLVTAILIATGNYHPPPVSNNCLMSDIASSNNCLMFGF